MYDPKAIIQESPFHWNGREGYTPKWLVLHSTSGPGAVSWFQNTTANNGQGSQVSTNYVIEKDGSIIGVVDEDNAGYSNGSLEQGHDAFWDTLNGVNPNLVTISIEHSKAVGNLEDLTDAQQASSFYLIKAICQRHNIPMRQANASGGITGHYSLDPISRSQCPGNYPWQALWTFLAPPVIVKPTLPVSTLVEEEYPMGVPNGWTDSNNVLIAPNGHKVVLGFRDFILNNRWNPDDYPLQEQQHRQSLEVSNPSLGEGDQLVCRMSVLGYTKARGVFKEWPGQELLVLRSKLGI